jgi:WD40 repeat protein
MTDLAFGPEGDKLIAGSFDWGTNIAFLDLANGRVIAQGLPGHTNEVFAVAFSPTGQVAA